MRVTDNCNRAFCNSHPGKNRRYGHGTFYMHMSIHQPWQDVLIIIVFFLFNTNDLPVFNGNFTFKLPPGNGVNNNPQVLFHRDSLKPQMYKYLYSFNICIVLRSGSSARSASKCISFCPYLLNLILPDT